MANGNLFVSNEWMVFGGGGFLCRSDLLGDLCVWLFVRLILGRGLGSNGVGGLRGGGETWWVWGLRLRA